MYEHIEGPHKACKTCGKEAWLGAILFINPLGIVTCLDCIKEHEDHYRTNVRG